MKHYFWLFIFLFGGRSLIPASFSQGGDLKYKSFSDFKEISWINMVDTGKQFIFAAEVHEVSCNYPYSFSLISALFDKGYNNLILEMPFSYGLLCNEYLRTGNDSLLYFISRTENAAEFWRSLFTLRKNTPSRQLAIWGVDFELDGGRRGEFFMAAIQLLLKRNGSPIPEKLTSILQNAGGPMNYEKVLQIKRALANASKDTAVRAYFGNDYTAFSILVNRNDKYHPGRDAKMFNNFLELHETFLVSKPQKYFAQFGWGHAQKSNRRSFAVMLAENSRSPVRNSVFFIGSQYINCRSNVANNDSFLNANAGVINASKVKKQLERLTTQDPSPIKVMDTASVLLNPAICKEADMLVIFSNFNATTTLKR